ncbi:MAG: MerR family transcriptional regulator [Desulfobacterales bacterium]
MRELVRAAGVPKSTVHFYLAAGLLPPPVRTGPNTAWYNPECVARIELIRRLQREERLRLAEIAERLRGLGKAGLPQPPPTPRQGGKDSRPEVFSRRTACDAEGFSRETGISRDQLARLVERGLILPRREGRFDAEDLAAGRALAALFAAGFDDGDLGEYADAAERLALRERGLLERRGGGAGAAADRLAALRRYLFVERRERLAVRKEKNAPLRGPQRDPEPWID